MSRPRIVLPEQCHLITRVCTQRQFLLYPDELTSQIVAYCMAFAAKKANVQLVAWLFMSNHYHAVIYDPEGRHPEFTECCHLLIAKALNRRHDRRENVWATEETSVVRLVHPEDVFDKVVYTLMNPVAAGLRERTKDWPGFSSLPFMGKGPVVIKRPPGAFSEHSALPEEVELVAVVPPTITEPHGAWLRRVRDALRAGENAEAAHRKRTNKPIKINEEIEIQKWKWIPDSSRAKEEHGEISPVIACKNPEDRETLKKALKEFYFEHREARFEFMDGNYTIEFPCGTYRMRLIGARTKAKPKPS